MDKLAFRLLVVVLWSFMCYNYTSNAKLKLSIHDLFLMVPQWCEMTDLVGSGFIELSPQNTLVYCATTVILLVVCWYRTTLDDFMETNYESVSLEVEVKECETEEEEVTDLLWESAKSLVDQVDLEYSHCSASIAANNETPGKIVGGEAEWASGETNSDDEDVDATREITGAHLRKSLKAVEDTEILRIHQQPLNCDLEAKAEKESQLTKEPNLKPLSKMRP